MIASTQPLLCDGRKDRDGRRPIRSGRLIEVIEEHAESALLIDMDALARQSGSIINAVMLGAIAGCGRLPLKLEQFEAAIREDGKSVDSNLRGFRAGYEAARATAQPARLVEKTRNCRRYTGIASSTKSRAHFLR